MQREMWCELVADKYSIYKELLNAEGNTKDR